MGSRISVGKIEKIKELRIHGASIPEIADKIKISKATALRYIKGVEIAPEYFHLWFGKRGGSKRRKHNQEIKAKEEAFLTSSPKVYVLAALYWAEGSKKDFNFINSDPMMLSLFVNLLRSELKVEEHRIRVSIRIYRSMDEFTCKQYWSSLLNISLENFAHTEKTIDSGNIKYIHGLCRIRVSKGGYLLKYLKSLAERLHQESSPHSSTDRARVS